MRERGRSREQGATLVIAVGVMSGTSADGIDVAAVAVDDPGPGRVRVLATAHVEYAPELAARVLSLAAGEPARAGDIALLHADLGDAYARAVLDLLPSLAAAPEVIALHGQTVAHLPTRGATLQLGDAARVAFRTGVPTVTDLRSADVAAGGQGAPLVPFADHVLFAHRAPLALLNLGGVANLTLMPSARAEDIVAFDTGPGNLVSDAIARDAGAPFDDGGRRAARGTVDQAALGWALAHAYFARPAPKSTGRDDFDQAFIRALVLRVTEAGGGEDDALATAVALTARTVAEALARETPARVRWAEVAVAGGGVRNGALMAALTSAVAPLPLRTTDALGIPPLAREAIAFAILGAYRIRGLPNTLPWTTGASRAVCAGAVHRP